jgi:hypothetical protein
MIISLGAQEMQKRREN